MTEVERCIPVVSRNAPPFGEDWRWDCPQCDKGRVVGTHSNTKYAAKQHAKDAYAHKVRVAEYAVWDAAIMSTDDVRVFRALAVQRYKRLARDDWQPHEAAMRGYQTKMREVRNSMASRVVSEIVLTRGA